jgi:hypothetical protein
MHLQHGFKNLVSFMNGNLGRGYNGNLPFDTLIDDKIFSGKLADKFDQYIDIHVVEINGNEFFGICLPAGFLLDRLCAGCGVSQQLQRVKPKQYHPENEQALYAFIE